MVIVFARDPHLMFAGTENQILWLPAQISFNKSRIPRPILVSLEILWQFLK